MSIAKSALRRSMKLVSLAGGLWREEMIRIFKAQGMDASRVKQAKMLIEELGQLKGAAMKLGQSLALEARDYLPDEVVSILDKLQNQASFLKLEEVREILERELGERAPLIESLSAEPIAAASIGQVHRARFRNTDIALKVQYPGIQDTVDADIKILKRLVEFVSPWIGKSQTDYTGLFQEFREVFHQETSYIQEAESTIRYGKFAKALDHVRVPEVFAEISSDRVLALSFERGMSLSECLRNKLFDRGTREKLAQLFLTVYSSEFCDWGMVQTDPNLGNFLIDKRGEELVLLDFGAARSYPLDFRKTYSRIVLAALVGNRKECLELADKIHLIDPREKETAKEAFINLMTSSMVPFRHPSFDFGSSDYTQTMRGLAKELIWQLEYSPPPRSLIFLHRKLGGLFQILRRLEVRLDLRPFLQGYERLARDLPLTPFQNRPTWS